MESRNTNDKRLCNNNIINCSIVICFSKNTANVAISTTATKRKGWAHNISVEMAEQLKHKEMNVIPGWKLCRNCHQKTKDLADNEVSINECGDGDVVDKF